MRRGSGPKLSKLLLEAAERVNPHKPPRPHSFPVRSDPGFQHPFGLPDARNVLFMGNGAQFGRWANELSAEVFHRTLVFTDLDAWRWQSEELAAKLRCFFDNPVYGSLPASSGPASTASRTGTGSRSWVVRLRGVRPRLALLAGSQHSARLSRQAGGGP